MTRSITSTDVKGAEAITIDGEKYSFVRSTFRAEGRTFDKIKFVGDNAPTLTLQLSMKVAGALGQDMLNLDESIGIRDNRKTNAAFRGPDALEPGEWSHVRDVKSEENGASACLGHDGGTGGLGAYRGVWDDVAASVVLLKTKENGSGAVAQTGSITAAIDTQLKQIAVRRTEIEAEDKFLAKKEEELTKLRTKAIEADKLESKGNELLRDAAGAKKEISQVLRQSV